MATGTAQCPICQEDIKDPRLLPCIHSFCLECLQRYCRDKLPGDDVPCPECRSEFQIPKNGVADLPIRTHTKESVTLSEQGSRRYCGRHDERIKMHCFSCNINVCAMCCLEDHTTHKFEKTEEVADRFSKSIDDEIKQVTSRIEGFQRLTEQLKAEHCHTLDNIKVMELDVQNRRKKIKEIADRQESELLQQLQLLRSASHDEIKSRTDSLQSCVSEMESFRTSSLELMSTSSPSDITQAANDVHERAKELLQTYVIPSEYHAPIYKFTPANIDELLRDDQNFIGHVVEVTDSGNFKSYYRDFFSS